jgi:hypothetical protein
MHVRVARRVVADWRTNSCGRGVAACLFRTASPGRTGATNPDRPSLARTGRTVGAHAHICLTSRCLHCRPQTFLAQYRLQTFLVRYRPHELSDIGPLRLQHSSNEQAHIQTPFVCLLIVCSLIACLLIACLFTVICQMAVEAASSSFSGPLGSSRRRQWDQASIHEMLYKGRIGIGVVVESLDQRSFTSLAHELAQVFFTAAPLELS